jgi:soluble P-type ATPase
MIAVDIPGFGALSLEHLVLDYNGTIALDGALLPGVADALGELAATLDIHAVTADTFGTAAKALSGLAVELVIAPGSAQAEYKLQVIDRLSADRVVAIGNGRNDQKMLRHAALGIVVIQREGAAVESLSSADIVTTDILHALSLLQNPQRLVATLRS